MKSRKGLLAFQIIVVLLGVCLFPARDHATPPAEKTPKPFAETADQALAAMKKRAEELHIKGVGMVAFSEGDKIESWSSKMLIVGGMKKRDTATEPEINLLAIAYSKAAESVDTLKDSGSKVRPPMTGEFGWEGGVIAKVKTGHLIVAFSGGSSEDDLKVSKVGLQVLTDAM